VASGDGRHWGGAVTLVSSACSGLLQSRLGIEVLYMPTLAGSIGQSMSAGWPEASASVSDLVRVCVSAA
jgi:hypothetical protein